MEWQPIETAPKQQVPVWTRGWDRGKPDTTRHYQWAYFSESGRWETEDGSSLDYLTDWLPMAATPPTKEPTP